MEIVISDISKSFGKKKVLEHIDLVAEKKEILCLLGPSGSGKTTLIRLMIGAMKADQGEITVEGTLIPNMDILKRIGYMPQNDAVYTDITGYANLEFFGRQYGMSGKNLKTRIEEILELVKLTPDKGVLVSKYSGGMKKRLSLAIALLHNPDILILDEPTVGIDPVLRRTIWAEFAYLASQGKTLVISTHVMDEAVKCNRIALLYEGRMIMEGTVPELLSKTSNDDLEELFFMAQSGGVQ